MGRLEHDWRVVTVATAVSAVVTAIALQMSASVLAFAYGWVVAGTVAGVLVPVEDFAGSEGAFGAYLGSVVGTVIGHPSLVGAVGKFLGESQSAVTPEVVGTSRVIVAALLIPVAMVSGFVVARAVSTARRGLGPDDDSLELDDPTEWQ